MRSTESDASALMKAKLRQQSDTNVKLQPENVVLKRNMADLQSGFQSEINALKLDLQAQVRQRHNDVSHRDRLSDLWKELQADDRIVKQEITDIIKKSIKRRSALFESAKN